MMNAVKKQERNRKQPTQVVKHRHISEEATRLEQLRAEENTDRESLFSGMVATVTKTLDGMEGAKKR